MTPASKFLITFDGKNRMENSENQKSGSNIILLVLFWAYVLIPLAWGVTQTFKKAMLLFH